MANDPAFGQAPRLDILVAVHGIGDQVPYETLRHLIYRCFEYRKLPAGVPLGEIATRLTANTPQTGRPAWAEFTRLPGLAFTEVFWADIGRQYQDYVLEDTVSWAKTLTGRLQVLENRLPPQVAAEHAKSRVDLAAVERTLGDIGVVVKLVRTINHGCSMLGIGSVDLDRMLTNFLGDVQLLAEFAPQRAEILERFHDVMSAIEKDAIRANREVRIHICAHSQGSAVALLGLLQGWSTREPWLKRVRSLMTIGSPIDKFLILWPDLWNGFFDQASWRNGDVPIQWHNYADRGDPVGYELDTARLMVARLDPGLFEKDAPKDVIYSRYPLPGKAHVDYWCDQDVFNDWLGSCVEGGAGVAVLSRRGMAAIRLTITFALPIALGALCAHAFAEAVNGVLLSPAIGFGHVVAIAAAVMGSVAIASATRASKRLYWPTLGALSFLAGSAWIVMMSRGHEAMLGCLALLVTSMCPVWWPKLRTSQGLRACMRALVILGSAIAILWNALNANISPWASLVWLCVSMVAWWLATLLWDMAVVWVEYVGRGRHLAYLRRTLSVPIPAKATNAAVARRTRMKRSQQPTLPAGGSAQPGVGPMVAVKVADSQALPAPPPRAGAHVLPKTRLWWLDCGNAGESLNRK